MPARETNNSDAEALALQALVWTLQDDARAERLLSVTGLDAETLRQSLGNRALLAGTIEFLEAHEPDLVACAGALDVSPETLVLARERLGR